MTYPLITAVATRGGHEFRRYDGADLWVPLGWSAGKRAEIGAEVLRLRAELAASRPAVCATCRRPTEPGLLVGDDCITCDAARYVPKGK